MCTKRGRIAQICQQNATREQSRHWQVRMDLANQEPWWSEMLKRHGIPALFAIILLLAILGLIPSDIRTTRQLTQQHIERDQEELVLLRLICQHTSKDRAEIDACTQAPRRDLASE
jgi:hypothetical protein